jgi:hypothetical protein
MTFAGTAAMVRDSRGGVHRYALVEGTRLSVGAAEMIAADVPVSAGAAIEDGRLRASVTCEEPVQVALYCPVEPQMMKLTGMREAVDVTYDPAEAALTLGLPAGRHEVTVRGR